MIVPAIYVFEVVTGLVEVAAGVALTRWWRHHPPPPFLPWRVQLRRIEIRWLPQRQPARHAYIPDDKE